MLKIMYIKMKIQILETKNLIYINTKNCKYH